MSFTGISELIEQAAVTQVALEALTIVMTVLICLTLVAFVVYLASVIYLCLAEVRRATTLKQTPDSRRPETPGNSECAVSDQPDGRAESRANVSWAEAK